MKRDNLNKCNAKKNKKWNVVHVYKVPMLKQINLRAKHGAKCEKCMGKIVKQATYTGR